MKGNTLLTTRSEQEEPEEEQEDNFHPCGNCDLPDACEDFGCAVKQGIKQITWE
jgi:hypothetical protein